MKILVPIDGSEYSQRAMEAANKLGDPLNAEITLLNVVPPPVDIRNVQNRELYSELNQKTTNRSLKLLNEGLEFFKDFKGDIRLISRHGDAADEVIKFAEDNDYDLIIMGRRGIGRFSRAFLGSVSNKVVNYSKISVLVVK